MTYNSVDNMWYCTNAQRLALDITKLQDTSKYYEVDTKLIYVVFAGAWYQM